MDLVQAAVQTIQNKTPNFKPQLALTLGSGLGSLADKITDGIKISYKDIPGFPVSSVAGHAGQMILGYLNKTPVVCLQGRVHLYEGTPVETISHMIHTLKQLGCETYFATNAAGSFHPEVGAGELMLITDHINFMFKNPLVGPNDESIGPRFVPMDGAYNTAHGKKLLSIAEKLNINLSQGTYLAVLGPNFETPAEIRAYKILGADAVGMSTVPEVLAAHHCGMRVAAISAITNLAAGIQSTPLSHEETLHFGKIAAEKLSEIILKFTEDFS